MHLFLLTKRLKLVERRVNIEQPRCDDSASLTGMGSMNAASFNPSLTVAALFSSKKFWHKQLAGRRTTR